MDSISQIALIDHGIDLERAQIARVAAWSRHWLERKMLNNNKYPTITPRTLWSRITEYFRIASSLRVRN